MNCWQHPVRHKSSWSACRVSVCGAWLM